MAAGNSSRKTPSNASPGADKPPSLSTTLKLKKSASKLGTPSVASSVRSDSPATNADENAPSQNSDKKGSAEETSTKRCTHCKQHMPVDGFDAHSRQCLRDKKERKRKEKEAKDAADRGAAEGGSVLSAVNDEAPLASLPKSAKEGAKKSAAPSAAANQKKRKADNESTAGDTKPPAPKKQKKKESEASAKAKTGGGAKAKGPVDVEKQCGVLLPNGAMCARSLTCKSHAMGAKRAVPGRSLPYDVLLAQYQKKNQAKLQKAAIASNQPLPDDLSLDGPSGPIDSDEERDAVMAGIARAAPRPLNPVRHMVSVRAKYNNIRMKEMLASAMGGNRGGGLFSTAGWSGHARAAQQASAADGATDSLGQPLRAANGQAV